MHTGRDTGRTISRPPPAPPPTPPRPPHRLHPAAPPPYPAPPRPTCCAVRTAPTAPSAVRAAAAGLGPPAPRPAGPRAAQRPGRRPRGPAGAARPPGRTHPAGPAAPGSKTVTIHTHTRTMHFVGWIPYTVHVCACCSTSKRVCSWVPARLGPLACAAQQGAVPSPKGGGADLQGLLKQLSLWRGGGGGCLVVLPIPNASPCAAISAPRNPPPTRSTGPCATTVSRMQQRRASSSARMSRCQIGSDADVYRPFL